MPLARFALALAAALVLVANPLAGRADDGPRPVAPDAKAFRLGALQLAALRGGGWHAANDGTVFGLNATRGEVTALLAKAGAPTDVVLLDVDALLVRLPGHVVLIDAGLPPSDGGVVLRSLALAGVAPADVTDVLITHGHLDHIGGLLTAEGWRALPSAVVRMSAREWAALQAQAGAAAMVKTLAPQVRTFEPGGEVLPGITSIALYGHTPGHVGYEIRSGAARLIDIGDVAHSSIISLAKPDWTIDFDEDRAAGARTRRAELTKLAADGTLVFAPHFPFPGLGHIARAGDGFVWRPVRTP
ncbi:MAG TPA: MBL fold metallo-hydrolase [Caulobacteraceae bacterium]|nr:MBL fold metallo-hydrolase [Caulobacteraceae bacterium]